MPLRIVFCGTPAFAAPTLRHLIAQPDFQIVEVVTQPDRPRGRGGEISVSPVKSLATEAGIPVYQPQRIKEPAAEEHLRSLAADAIVIIAYGQIIPALLIAIPRLGWINLHGSLLPKYRGAAPIQWAIASGETRTGLTTMQIDAGLDTGPMLLKFETEIAPDETSVELAARLAQAGAPLMTETLRKLDRGDISPIRQDESQKSLAPPLKKEDGRLDWSLSPQEIYNRIRGFDPWPGAFSLFRGKTCHIWGKPAQNAPESHNPGTILIENGAILAVAGHNGALQLEFVQMEGRKKITAREFANGARLVSGDKFGD